MNEERLHHIISHLIRDLSAEMEKLQKAEVLVVGDKKYIEYDMVAEFTERLIKSQREAVREFADYIGYKMALGDVKNFLLKEQRPDETTSDKWRTQGYVEGGTDDRS